MKRENFVQIMLGIKNALCFQKENLSMDEAVLYLDMKKSYLYKLTSERKIPHCKSAGGKMIYFKRAELDNWMTFFKIKTLDELRETKINTK